MPAQYDYNNYYAVMQTCYICNYNIQSWDHIIYYIASLSLQFDSIIKKTLDAEGDETDNNGYNKSVLPVEADFIIAYATVPGYVSWRHPDNGSWFIKAFTETMFKETGKEHFLDILTIVNGRVAEEFQSAINKSKQMPAPVTMLRRKLYFRPGFYE